MLGFNEPLNFIILSFWSIFVIVDPVGSVPTFLAMTERDSPQDRIRTARLASLVTFFVLVGFSLGGIWILSIFGISLSAFKVAGGIVLLKVALDMLQAKQTAIKETPEEKAEGVTKDDIAVTPLAVPILAGPGAITAVVLLTTQATDLFQKGIVLFNIALVSVIVFLTLRIAALRSSIFSAITLKIIARLMGLLLAAVATQFILDGIQDVTNLW